MLFDEFSEWALAKTLRRTGLEKSLPKKDVDSSVRLRDSNVTIEPVEPMPSAPFQQYIKASEALAAASPKKAKRPGRGK